MDEVNAVFERVLPVIRSTLKSYYHLTDRDALEGERNLHVWFHRFARRSGVAQGSVRSLRLSLLVAACQYGRTQGAKQTSGPPEESFVRALAREPEDLASELAAGLDADS